MPLNTSVTSVALFRSALGHSRRLPLRYQAVVVAAHTLILFGVGPLISLVFSMAMNVAGLSSLTDRNFSALLSSPGAIALLVAAACVGVCVTIASLVVMLTVADMQLEEVPPSLRQLWARVRRSLRRMLSPASLAPAVQVMVILPLIGVAIFSPLTSGLELPPFIEREFMKVPLSAVGWDLIAGVLIYFTFRTILAMPFGVVRGDRPTRSFVASVAATRDGGLKFAAVLTAVFGGALLASRVVGEAIAATAEAVSNVGVDTAPFVFGGRMILAVVSIMTAVVIAFMLVDRARAFSGLASSTVPRSVGHRRPARPILVRAAVAASVVIVSTGIAPVSPAVAAGSSSGSAVIIAHRGYDTGGVENTIGGLEAAQPFHPDFVEVDIQQTRDGGFVASHDSNLLMMAGLDANIFDMTTEQVTSTVVTMHGHSDVIPTMGAYAKRARELGLHLLIEFKVTGNERPGFVEAALTELESADELDGNIFHSLDATVVHTIKRVHPELRVGLTLAMFGGELPALDCDFYVVEQASVTPELIASAHRMGKPVYAWTVNSPRTMRNLLREGVDGLVTDRPAAARNSREEASMSTSQPGTTVRDQILGAGLLR